VTDVTGTAVAGAPGLGGTGRSEPCAPGGTAYSLDSGAYTFQVCCAPLAAPLSAAHAARIAALRVRCRPARALQRTCRAS
jgi:hypothetical protein